MGHVQGTDSKSFTFFIRHSAADFGDKVTHGDLFGGLFPLALLRTVFIGPSQESLCHRLNQAGSKQELKKVWILIDFAPGTDQAVFDYVEVAVGGPSKRGQVMRLSDFAPPADVSDVYMSWLRFTSDLADYAAVNVRNGRPSVAAYPGPAKAEFFPIDFDAYGDLQPALEDVRALLSRLRDMGVPDEAVRACWSGRKGFHVELPEELFGGFVRSPDIAEHIKRLAGDLLVGVKADFSIYNKMGLWRRPNTMHGKSGLYKVRLSVDELMTASLESIRELASVPRNVSWLNTNGSLSAVSTLVEMKAASEPTYRNTIATGEQATVQEGGRDDFLTRQAGKLRRANMNPDAALSALHAVNGLQCDPPLDERQVEKVFNSVWGYAAGDMLVTAPLTDLGNAERLVALHGDEFRYLVSRRAFLVWDGCRWRQDDFGQMTQWAKNTLRATQKRADGLEDVKRTALLTHGIQSERSSRIDAMLRLARDEPGISVRADELDTHPMLMNVKNGTLDLSTGELRAFERADMLTQLIPVEYDADALAPRWVQFLNEVFEDNQEMVGFVQRAIGYSLTGEIDRQVLFFCFGDGANGKSTLLNTLLRLWGEFGSTTSFDNFSADRRTAINNELAHLVGKRLVVASESEQEMRLAEGKVKSATGGDEIQTRFLYGELFTYRPQFKLWLAVNHMPDILGTDNGIWRRIRLIPFTRQFGPDEQDPKLAAKLAAELSGILAWAVEGVRWFNKVGLLEPDDVTHATEEYREQMDIIATFVSDRCVLKIGADVRSEELYRAFMAWCEENGHRSPSVRGFGAQMMRKGFKKQKLHGGQACWVGLRLRPAMVVDHPLLATA